MNDNDTNLVPSGEEQKLFTSAELAQKFNMSKSNMDKRIRRLGVKPEVPAVDTQQGRKPALYNLETLAKIEEEEEEMILAEKQRNAARKIAEGMSLIGQQAFIRTVYDELTLEQKTAFTMESILALLQAMEADKKRLEEENAQKDAELSAMNDQVQVLSIHCDVSKDYFPAIRTSCGTLTRQEHQHLCATAEKLGFTDGELPYGWTQETFDVTKKYARIQVKSANDKYPAWAYHKDVWAEYNYYPNNEGTLLIQQS